MNSKYLNAVLTVIALMLALNVWVGIHQSPAASAFDPASQALAVGTADAGTQRVEMINQLKAISDKIDGLKSKLSDGSIKVTVESQPTKD